jgi:succinoglycan biosynthesis protein ExoM
MLCSVCVATYRRPGLLQKLIESLEGQTLREDIELEIIVVDNDDARSAEAIVQATAQHGRWPVRYRSQPIKNISLARNEAVEGATGQYLLFIDDDEEASPTWVASLVATRDAYDADGVFGPVLPSFHAGTPAWMRQAGLFGLTVSQTGAPATAMWSGNCLMKAELLKRCQQPFDPEYGLSGGEDTHLFDRLRHEGARFVYCREAVVWELVPAERACIRYLIRRDFRGGQAHTRRMIERAGSWRLAVRLLMIAKALCFGMISLLMSVGTWPARVTRIRWLLRLASNAGRLTAAMGWQYVAYR